MWRWARGVYVTCLCNDHNTGMKAMWQIETESNNSPSYLEIDQDSSDGEVEVKDEFGASSLVVGGTKVSRSHGTVLSHFNHFYRFPNAVPHSLTV